MVLLFSMFAKATSGSRAISTRPFFCPVDSWSKKLTKCCQISSQPIVVYCAGGVRSALAAKTLQDLGYTDVYSMRGGYGVEEQWVAVRRPRKVGKDQMARYSRHLRIPEVGEKGQLKLLRSKVLLVGAGGLGSPAGVYLAASGVGTIGLVDYDVVDESNLQRQILHWTSSVGMPKVDSARRTLFEVNPDVKVRTYNLRPGRFEYSGYFQGIRCDRQRIRQFHHRLYGERRRSHAEETGRLRKHLPVRWTGLDIYSV